MVANRRYWLAGITRGFPLRVQSFITALCFSQFEPKGSSTKQLSTRGKLSGDRYAAELSSARAVVSAVIMLSKETAEIHWNVLLTSSPVRTNQYGDIFPPYQRVLTVSYGRCRGSDLWKTSFCLRVKNKGNCDFKPCNCALISCNCDYILQCDYLPTQSHKWDFASRNCTFISLNVILYFTIEPLHLTVRLYCDFISQNIASIS